MELFGSSMSRRSFPCKPNLKGTDLHTGGSELVNIHLRRTMWCSHFTA